MTKLKRDHFGSMFCTDSRADMLSVPPSQLSYAPMCVPSPISRHPQHLNSVRNALIRRGRIEPAHTSNTTYPPQNTDALPAIEGEQSEMMQVRFRTIGDMTSTGAVKSPATTLEDIIQEVAATRVTERGGRADDKRSEASMEDRKKEGYF